VAPTLLQASTCRLKDRIAIGVIAMEMRVHHSFDGLFGNFVNAVEQVLVIPRMLRARDAG
jgi:hypothetical protein